MAISNEKRREVARELRELDVSDLGDDGNIVDTPEESGVLFSRILEVANDYRPGLHYAMSHFRARDAVELFADLIDRPAIKPEPSGRAYWRCPRCGAFNYRSAVTDCCGVIPAHYCANCGAEVVE